MTIDSLSDAYKDFLKQYPSPPVKQNQYVTWEVIVRICEHLLFDETEDQISTKIPDHFITIKQFCDDTLLANPEWIRKIVSKNIPSSVAMKATSNIWFVDADQLLHWFIDREERFPVMSARCFRYLERSKK